MCVVAFSPKGVDIPTPEQIKKMWQHNPDGAGYAFTNRKGKVEYHKGFMTLESLLKELENPERFKHTNFAIHFRIGTSGKNDKATCHPFPLSTTFGELRKTDGVVDSVLFHNGILSDGGIASPLSSDTQDFVIAMTPLLHKYNRSKARDHFIGELVKGNRLLILYKNNAFKMFGEWEKDGDLWVSNLNYKNSYNWYGDGYYDWHSYMYDDYYMADLYGDDDYTDGVLTEDDSELDERAKAIWNNIIENEYAFLNGIGELELLKATADSFTKNHIEKGGYVLGYDAKQFLVWLEETPYPKLKGSED